MAVAEAKFDWQDATAFSFSVFLLQTCQSDGTWTKHIAYQYLITLGSMDTWFGLHREKVLCMHLRLKQNPYLSLSISTEDNQIVCFWRFYIRSYQYRF